MYTTLINDRSELALIFEFGFRFILSVNALVVKPIPRNLITAAEQTQTDVECSCCKN